MQHEPSRVEDDLRGLISGDVYCDPVRAMLYASDASVFQAIPLGVVRPRSRDDVMAVVKYASENNLTLHPRGAATTTSGGALGTGLILDFSRYMHRIREVGPDVYQIQPGATLARIARYLAPAGMWFPVEPPGGGVRTIGGVVACDAVGSRWLRDGAAHRYVTAVEAVLPDGSLHQFGNVPLEPRVDKPLEGVSRDLVRGLARLFRNHEPSLDACRTRETRSPGMRYAEALREEGLDLARLLCGSGGRLAVFTDVSVRAGPLPQRGACGLFYFESLAKAAEAAQHLLERGPLACDLMDRRLLSIAREDDVHYELVVPSFAEAVLLVEFDARPGESAAERLAAAARRVQDELQLVAATTLAQDADEEDLFWALADSYSTRLSRIRGPHRPVHLVDDMLVPPDQLGDFLADVQALMQHLQVTFSTFSHCGPARVRVVPFLDLPRPAEREKLRILLDGLTAAARERGGGIAGGPGKGFIPDHEWERQFGPLWEVSRGVKACFDPRNLFNPPWSPFHDGPGRTRSSMADASDPPPTGGLNPAAASESVSWHGVDRAAGLRPFDRANADSAANRVATDRPDAAVSDSAVDGTPQPTAATEVVPLQLEWSSPSFVSATRDCNGCGTCRASDNRVRMCPIFHVTSEEEASPRAKANLMRAVGEEILDYDSLCSDAAREVVSLCVHCHMCRLECPAEVDIPRLMLEARAAQVAARGMGFADWFFVHIDGVSRFFSRFHRPANWALKNPAARWLLEKTAGVARGRRLPALAPHTFGQLAYRRGLTRRRRRGVRVALFVDTYANYYDPHLAEATVSVLEHNGVSVFVPPAQLHSAMPMISTGAIEAARKIARQNIDIFAEAVRQGYTVVATEPSAALALTHEYPILLPDDEDARMVSLATREACHYLWKLHLGGSLRLDFKRLETTLVYHAPCHLKALDVGTPGENLMRLIPGLKVRPIEKGCSGMAGVWGLRRDNHRQSLRAGRELINAVRDRDGLAGVTECSTCKMQMEQSSPKSAVHPIKVLAEAYGVLPKGTPRLPRHSQEESA